MRCSPPWSHSSSSARSRLTGGELSELFEVVATDFEAINDENAALLE
jgi:hypothetical protein